MICSRCGSHNVQVQVVNEVKTKRKHGLIYWLVFGWWLEPTLWILLTFPKLLFAIFGNHKKVVSKSVTYAVCQDCGCKWELKQ